MDLETFPQNETAKRMLSYVTQGFYDESYVGKWLYQVMGTEMEEAAAIFDELPYQVVPETASWGLGYLEEKYGLPNRKDLSDDERRKRIIQKRDTRAPMTPYAMERLLKTVTDFQIRVSDINDRFNEISRPAGHPNIFQVILTGEGSADIGKIRPLLDRIKQSHVLYDLMYYQIYKYTVDIKYENAIRFRTGFYPRYNLAFLYLDRTWRLKEKVLYGYDTDSLIDFYPVYIQFQIPVKNRVRAGQQLKFVSGAREEIAGCSAFQCRTESPADSTGEARLAFQLSAAEQASVGTIQVMNLNILDTKWKLDGSRKLNGGLSIL